MKSKDKLKKKLHELIDSIDDEDLLKMLNEDIVPYIINNRVAELDAGDDLSKEEQKKLKAAIKEADRGETISHKEFKAAVAKWLAR
jgi:adenine C2-methylase RlmN of 23S rRNA A2503 and tRNA A37